MRTGGEMSDRQYRIDIEPLSARLGGGFVATVPELKGCIADGDSREEALRNAYDAIECWLEDARQQGLAIPEPAPVGKQFAF
jgi:antitoxin HicB